MPDDNQEWISIKDLAELLDVPAARIYTALSALRRTTGVNTKSDPDDYRITLIDKSAIDAIKKFLRIK
jgi:DNA-binding IclR family transcriptional regulator